MEISIKEIYKLLQKQNLNPNFIKKDSCRFLRWIEFETKYQKCWIEWYSNFSTLRVGDRYGVQIPFTNVKVNDTYPDCIKCLKFGNCEVTKNYGLAPQETYLILEKLIRQEDLTTTNKGKDE